MASEKLTIEQLEAVTGVYRRTLRNWVGQRLLPRPTGRGRSACYDQRHVLRARVIQVLREKRLSLRKIRSRIGSRSDAELRAMLPKEPRRSAPGTVGTAETAEAGAGSRATRMPPPEPSYPSVMWEVVELTEGLVLLVDSTRGPAVRRLADDVYRYFGAPQGVSRAVLSGRPA